MAVKLYSDFAELYGTSWTREHGVQMSEKMACFLNTVTTTQYQRILTHCKEKLKTWSGAPSLGELIIWSDMPTKIELIQAYARVMEGEHETNVEYWLVSKWLYNLKRTPIEKLEREFNRLYMQGVELEKMGKLFSHETYLKSLPACSVKNMNDLAHEKQRESPTIHRHMEAARRIGEMIRFRPLKS